MTVASPPPMEPTGTPNHAAIIRCQTSPGWSRAVPDAGALPSIADDAPISDDRPCLPLVLSGVTVRRSITNDVWSCRDGN